MDSISQLRPLCRHRPKWMATLVLLLVFTAPLHAHHLPPGMEDVDEFEQSAAFMAGLRHPLLGFDHWLIAVATGWIAAASIRSQKLGIAASAAFAIGGLLGTQGVMLPGYVYSLTISLSVLVFALATQKRCPPNSAAGFVSLAALMSGNVHGLAWPIGSAAGGYITGLILTTFTLALVGFIAQRFTQSRSVNPALA